MKKLFCLCFAISFLLLYPQQIFTKQTKKDSLQNLIQQAKGMHKVDLLVEFTIESNDSNDTLKHLTLSDEIYKSANSLNYVKGRCESLIHMGCAKIIRLNDYIEALNNYSISQGVTINT